MNQSNLQTSKNYDQFSFLIANRSTSRSHINNLKKAIADHPEILEVQPILVNDKYQIIDGQHRFQAAIELDMPIVYTVVPGIGIEVARAMNVLQRKWEPADFAKSYAIDGNEHYKTYLKFREEYEELPHGIILLYLAGRQFHGINANFKKGYFEVDDEDAAHDYLSKLLVIQDMVQIPITKPFAAALLRMFKNSEFDFGLFKDKLAKVGNLVLRRSTTVEDYLRMLEEIYNHGLSKNRVRLF